MFAGFGIGGRHQPALPPAPATSGGTGLSTAFDMPTLMGRDSDDPLALGEVGKAGVAIDTLDDMDDLFAGIDLGAVSTSMTINGPAAILMAMYVAVAEGQGIDAGALSAARIQNDILKEYQAQKEYLFPPRPSLRLVTDLIRFTTAEMPRFHPVSISGYHIREAGSTADQELAFTLANGFAYVEAARRRPAWTWTTSRPGCPSSSTPTSTSSRRSASSAPPAGSGPGGCASATAPPTSARCGCGSTPRPPASRSPPSSPRSTSPASPSRPCPRCSAGPRACTPTPTTRRWPCPRRRRPASPCAPSRSSPTRPG